MNKSSTVHLQQYIEASLNTSQPEVENCLSILLNIIDNINYLYEIIRTKILNDNSVAEIFPMWMIDTGHSPESLFSKDIFEQLQKSTSHSRLINRFLYIKEIRILLNSINDRFTNAYYSLVRFYNILPSRQNKQDSVYEELTVNYGDTAHLAHMHLCNIFVALTSAFDLIAVIATEKEKLNTYNFKNYIRWKQKNIYFNPSIKEQINQNLIKRNLLFSFPREIKIIKSLRNEYVHSGSWNFKPAIYSGYYENNLIDQFIYCPDLDEQGNLIKSFNRNKFYSQGNKINFMLIPVLTKVLTVTLNTIQELQCEYQNIETNFNFNANDEKEKFSHINQEILQILNQYDKK